MKPVNPYSEEGKILIDYTRGALDAIGIKKIDPVTERS
jgi:hypothetical protein